MDTLQALKVSMLEEILGFSFITGHRIPLDATASQALTLMPPDE
jgi:hypothetical protein